jgi:transcriptional regulator with XRE-family HTH domain
LVARALHELEVARRTAHLSQRTLANASGLSSSAVGRLLAGEIEDPGVIRLSELASVLGYELSVGLHPIGDAVRDKAQLAIGKRFQALLSQAWRVTDEMLLPGEGERRAWDKMLRLPDTQPRQLVGVDIESRVYDVQAIVRRTRGRERDGHVDAILLVLADTTHNRSVVDELRSALGPAYATSPRALLGALREGRPLPGSGVILV